MKTHLLDSLARIGFLLACALPFVAFAIVGGMFALAF